MEGCVYFQWPFPWRKVLTGESIFNFTWGKSFALNDRAQSSYHDWHSNSRRGSLWPPRDHGIRSVPACPDDDLEKYFTLLWTTVVVSCINNMNIDTLGHFRWPPRRTPPPRPRHNNIYFLSTFLHLGCLVSANFWLPGSFKSNKGSACRTWRQFSGRWWRNSREF